MASLAGAAGGALGAYAEGSNILQGAISGAITGAAIGAGAVAGGHAGGNVGTPQDIDSVTITIEDPKTMKMAQEAGVFETIGDVGTSEQGDIILMNAWAGGGIAQATDPLTQNISRKIRVDIYSRPTNVAGTRHIFLHDRTNNSIWEVVSTCTDGAITTCGAPTAPLGYLRAKTYTGSAADNYLEKWANNIKFEYTVNLQQDSFYHSLDAYERRVSFATPYNPFWQNSNYAAQSRIRESGGDSQHVSNAPGS